MIARTDFCLDYRTLSCLIDFSFFFFFFLITCEQTNPIVSDRARLLKEAFQLLWVLAMHAPLPLKDMAQGAAVFNTMVN